MTRRIIEFEMDKVAYKIAKLLEEHLEASGFTIIAKGHRWHIP